MLGLSRGDGGGWVQRGAEDCLSVVILSSPRPKHMQVSDVLIERTGAASCLETRVAQFQEYSRWKLSM